MKVREILLKIDCKPRGYTGRVGCLKREGGIIKRFVELYRDKVQLMRDDR